MAGKGGMMHVAIQEERQEPKILGADLISILPDHVIHHILSFLPTIDVIRMSLLSRRWSQMWYSVPTLKFSEYGMTREIFCNFVEQCLEKRKMGMHRDIKSVITSFKLEMDYYNQSSQLDRWLSLIAQPHLQKLDLYLQDMLPDLIYYRLPEVVLGLKSLTVLNLTLMKLEACYPVSLPSLESLSLTYVQSEDEVLNNLLLGCPSLKKFCISECEKMHNLRVSNSSLELLEVRGLYWETIQVEAFNLQSFLYVGDCTCHFNLASCRKIKNLSLDRDSDSYPRDADFSRASFYPDKDLASLISRLHFLESLDLHGIGTGLIEIRNQHLQFLYYSVYKCKDKNEISIDAPNLVSFKFECWGENELVRCRFVNSPSLLEINICLYYNTHGLECCTNLIDFLSYFDCFRSINLFIRFEKVLMFPEILRKICRSPLPNVKHLRVKKTSVPIEYQRKSDLSDALLWLSPSAETISVE